MDDHIPGINEHPVGGLQAFDLYMGVPALLESLQQMVGKGADMAVRPSARDNHEIGNGRLAGQVDGYDFLRLVIIKRFDDEGFEGFTLLPAAFQAYRGGRSIIALAFDGQCRSSC